MKRAVFESLGTWRSAEDTANGRLRKKAMLRCVEVCCKKEDYVGCGRVISGFRTPRTALITHYSPFPVLPLNSGPGEISRTHVNHRFVAHRYFYQIGFHTSFSLSIGYHGFKSGVDRIASFAVFAGACSSLSQCPKCRISESSIARWSGRLRICFR